MNQGPIGDVGGDDTVYSHPAFDGLLADNNAFEPEPAGEFVGLIETAVVEPDEVLVARLRECELERRRLEAEIAGICAVLDTRGRFPDGHLTLKTFVRANLNLSGPSAGVQRQITRLVNRHPKIGDAWMAGQVGFDQVRLLAKVFHNRRVNGFFDEFVDQLLDAAVRFEYDEFALVIQRFMLGADPDGTHDDRDTAIVGRDARVVVNGGQLDVAVTGGDPLVAQEIRAVFEHFLNHEHQTDLAVRRAEHGDNAEHVELPRTSRQRRFDAFVAMIRAAATGTNPGRPVVDYCVNIVIDENRFNMMLAERELVPTIDLDRAVDHVLADPLGVAQRCETADGEPVHPHDVLRAALHGHIRRVIVDTKSVVIDMGRRERLFTGSARLATQLLTTQCAHPGCDLPTRWCDIDHNQAWTNGGRTKPDNGYPRCRPHHQQKEQLAHTTHLDRDGHRRTTRPDGTTILPVGMPPPQPPTPRESELDQAELNIPIECYTLQPFLIPHKYTA